ncbi:MAG: hypothetical protein GXX82_12960 [Syntrophorhabdus sp.]|nr:hypothetical protein [Syntrophorhabdus sp.]
MKSILFMLVFLFVVDPAGADRGPVLWHENVRLIQESQKAIILHNGTEEVLILGTELKASAEIDLLEFIPLPSEPEVGLAKGDPRGGASTVPVSKPFISACIIPSVRSFPVIPQLDDPLCFLV